MYGARRYFREEQATEIHRIKVINNDGSWFYQGPWANPATAKAQRTKWLKKYKVAEVILQRATNWEDV